MAKSGRKISGKRAIPALLAAAGLALALPATSGAVVGNPVKKIQRIGSDYVPFTPAKVDPRLARIVADTFGEEGLRFTPAARQESGERVVTMAVRVDKASAKAISFRSIIDGAGEIRPGLGTTPNLAATRYNLGTARGYQSFVQATPKSIDLSSRVRDLAMPDLSEFRPSEGVKEQPSRLQPRIAFTRGDELSRGPRPYDGEIDQSVDLGGAYRITRNLDVTAGVRVSQQRDRLAPLTDGVEDSKAIYLGTQLRF